MQIYQGLAANLYNKASATRRLSEDNKASATRRLSEDNLE